LLGRKEEGGPSYDVSERRVFPTLFARAIAKERAREKKRGEKNRSEGGLIGKRRSSLICGEGEEGRKGLEKALQMEKEET